MSILVDPPSLPRADKLLLFMVFYALWMLDAVYTIKFVELYGLGMEANPIVRYIIEHFGYPGLLLFKVLTTLPWAILYQRAKVWVHVLMILIMLPVVVLGYLVAYT